MKIAMPLNYAGDFEASARQVVELERAGLDLVWVAEAYGFDAVSFMMIVGRQQITLHYKVTSHKKTDLVIGDTRRFEASTHARMFADWTICSSPAI